MRIVKELVTVSSSLSSSKLLTALSAALLIGCGGGANPDRQEVGERLLGTEAMHVAAGASTLTFKADGSVEGTGSIRSTTPLEEAETNLSVAVTLQPGGRMTLISYSDIQLAHGIEIEYYRPDSGNSLQVLLRKEGNVVDVSAAFSGVDSNAPLVLASDVHNSENPAHLIIWNDSNGVAPADQHLVNTEDGNSPGQGSGKYWGIKLENAAVRTVVKSATRHEDE